MCLSSPKLWNVTVGLLRPKRRGKAILGYEYYGTNERRSGSILAIVRNSDDAGHAVPTPNPHKHDVISQFFVLNYLCWLCDGRATRHAQVIIISSIHQLLGRSHLAITTRIVAVMKDRKTRTSKLNATTDADVTLRKDDMNLSSGGSRRIGISISTTESGDSSSSSGSSGPTSSRNREDVDGRPQHDHDEEAKYGDPSASSSHHDDSGSTECSHHGALVPHVESSYRDNASHHSNNSGQKLMGDDESSSIDYHNAIAWKRAYHDKEAECEGLKATVAALTSALHEINAELRDKSMECNALQNTVKSLQQTLKESDQQLQELSLHCEQLDMKLQSVSFVESASNARRQGDGIYDDDDDDDRRSRRSRRSKKSKKKEKKKRKKYKKEKKSKRKSKRGEEGDDDDDEDDDDSQSCSTFDASTYADDTSVDVNSIIMELYEEDDDDSDEDDDDEDEDDSTFATAKSQESDTTGFSTRDLSTIDEENGVATDDDDDNDEEDEREDKNTFLPSGPPSHLNEPAQAAFYRVLYERDQVKREADRMRDELSKRRDQVRKLRGKLHKSTALIELCYEEDEQEVVFDAAASTSSLNSRDSDKSKKWRKERRRSLPSNVGLMIDESNATETSTAGSAVTAKSKLPLKWLMKGNKVKSAASVVAQEALMVFHKRSASPAVHQQVPPPPPDLPPSLTAAEPSFPATVEDTDYFQALMQSSSTFTSTSSSPSSDTDWTAGTARSVLRESKLVEV